MANYRNLRSKMSGFTLVEIMIVVLIIGILLAIAIPNFIRARESSRAKACQANLKQVDSAVQQWMMDNKMSSFPAQTQTAVGDTTFGTAPTGSGVPTTAQPLVSTYIRAEPACPEGGLYSTGNGGSTPVSCSLANTAGNFASGGTYPHTLGGT